MGFLAKGVHGQPLTKFKLTKLTRKLNFEQKLIEKSDKMVKLCLLSQKNVYLNFFRGQTPRRMF